MTDLTEQIAVTENPDIPPRIKLACDLSQAITMLYIHGIITETERAKARRRLAKQFPEHG